MLVVVAALSIIIIIVNIIISLRSSSSSYQAQHMMNLSEGRADNLYMIKYQKVTKKISKLQ